MRLREKNLQQELAVAASKLRLSSAKRQLETSESNLAKTVIRSPITGFVEKMHASVGDYLLPGDLCATLLDLDPIYIVSSISEQNIAQIELGAEMTASLATGEEVQGKAVFVGRQSKDESRTFRLEVAVPNPDQAIRSGLSAELKVPLEWHWAHRVSAALFVLNDSGEIGVRTVNDEQRVEFNDVEIISEDQHGL